MTVPQTYDECGTVIPKPASQCGEKQIPAHRHEHSYRCVPAYLILSQCVRSGQARHYQPYGEQGEKESRAFIYSESFPSVDCYVGENYTVGESVAGDAYGFPPAFHQEEPVEGKHFLVRYEIPYGQLDCGVEHESDERDSQRHPEQELEVAGKQLEQIYCGYRTYGRGQIVAQSVIAYAFGSARTGQHVNRHRARRYRNGAERKTVHSPEDCEHRKGSGGKIPRKHCHEEEIAYYEDCFPGETVNHITAERAHYECHHGISGEAQPYCFLVGPESVREVKRKQRNNQGEREMNQKISEPDLKIVGVP